MPRRQPVSHDAWEPTHRLRWTPRAGVAREWLVSLVRVNNDLGFPAFVGALTLEEAQSREPVAWVRTNGVWRWRGGGYRGEDGVAELLPITRR